MRSTTIRTRLAIFLAISGICSAGLSQQRGMQMRSPQLQMTNSRVAMMSQDGQMASDQMVAPSNTRMARKPIDSGRVISGQAQQVFDGQQGRVMPANYVPAHMRNQDGSANAPIVGEYSAPIATQNTQVVGGPSQAGCASCNGGVSVGQNYFSDDAMVGSCDSCGGMDCGLSGCLDCCDRGGCPPIGDCWIGKLRLLLYRAEYFGGAQGFSFIGRPNAQGVLQNQCNFGFDAGFNVGIPLCQLTCGLFSGQAGVRTVNSGLTGIDNAYDQLFITTGLYRRVDTGLQFGCVADIMQENWVVNNSLIQIRGDLSWVYYGGNAIGLRFAENVQDDVQNVPGTNFQLTTGTYDNYRFYYRHAASCGGYADAFLGWSDEKHIVGGMDYDLPITDCWALQSSFAYLYPADEARGADNFELWNFSVGFVFRPQGRCWYNNYDRPILPVADNGSMIIRRSVTGTNQ